MTRQYGFNGATTGTADLLTDLAVAQQAGFDALEIRDAKLEAYLAQGGALSDLVRTFAEARVLPLSLNALERSTPSAGPARQELLERTRTLCRWAAELGIPYVVAVPGPADGLDHDQIREASVEALREIAEIGRDQGVSIGFEFLGPTEYAVRTIAAAREIVEAVADPAVGMVIDTFHYYVGGSTPEMLRGFDPRRLFIVHLEDAEDRPREALTDAHRLLPGEGVIPLHQLVQALDAIGYDGAYSVELFRPEYWAWDPLDLARAARESLDALFAGIGES